jgi:ribosomal protein S18 acetylase RimI-like enzyme
MVVTIRPVCLPDDRAALLALDRSLTTDRVYRIARTPRSFALEEVPVAPALRKEFPHADDLGPERSWERGVVAEQDGAPVGFAAWTLRRWNRRTEVWHLYVAPAWRGQGIGRALLDAVVAAAREGAMRCVWLETSNLALPAVHFYEHLGFSLCGLDISLYDPAGQAGAETALYFARPV